MVEAHSASIAKFAVSPTFCALYRIVQRWRLISAYDKALYFILGSPTSWNSNGNKSASGWMSDTPLFRKNRTAVLRLPHFSWNGVIIGTSGGTARRFEDSKRY